MAADGVDRGDCDNDTYIVLDIDGSDVDYYEGAYDKDNNYGDDYYDHSYCHDDDGDGDKGNDDGDGDKGNDDGGDDDDDDGDDDDNHRDNDDYVENDNAMF